MKYLIPILLITLIACSKKEDPKPQPSQSSPAPQASPSPAPEKKPEAKK